MSPPQLRRRRCLRSTRRQQWNPPQSARRSQLQTNPPRRRRAKSPATTMEQAASFLAVVMQSMLPETQARAASGAAATSVPGTTPSVTARRDAGPPENGQPVEGPRPCGPSSSEATPSAFEVSLAADGAGRNQGRAAEGAGERQPRGDRPRRCFNPARGGGRTGAPGPGGHAPLRKHVLCGRTSRGGKNCRKNCGGKNSRPFARQRRRIKVSIHWGKRELRSQQLGLASALLKRGQP